MRVIVQLDLNGIIKTFYNRTKDLCFMLDHLDENPFFASAYDNILAYGNFLRRCPVEVGVIIFYVRWFLIY